MKLLTKKIINWAGVILWLGVIFYFSAQPNLKSELPNIWDFIFRKIAHAAEYFVLAYLLNIAFGNYHLKFSNRIIIVLFLCIMTAVLDEYNQTGILGRQGSARDISIDGLGATILLSMNYIYKRNNLIASSKSL